MSHSYSICTKSRRVNSAAFCIPSLWGVITIVAHMQILYYKLLDLGMGLPNGRLVLYMGLVYLALAI
ncbi:hypothetical protein SAMN06295960_3733 [Paenibacillus aquistagni]|uniref:Uncharacterized protein n=1 Tax=Paenibacillus aquistagni TaxID=1852522 RepID=A0A1X7LKZ5_9BACL|nr:hypothetical protein SAMN06295960_3733 [Paenibacillus aquistagni]